MTLKALAFDTGCTVLDWRGGPRAVDGFDALAEQVLGTLDAAARD